MRLNRQQLRARVGPERQWYRITNLADVAEVIIYDEIGYWGTSAETFLTELRGITASEITVRINSPGGEVFDGVAIGNVLRSHPARVTVHVDGLAASIASVIAMAGDRIIMQPNSQMMIHDGSGFCYGQASDMREMVDLLDKLSNNIASVYAERAGGTVEEWRERMLAETWYDAAEAVEAGLADEVAGPVRQPDQDPPANTWDLSVFRYGGRDQAPAPVAALTPEPVPAPSTEPVAEEVEPFVPEPIVDQAPDPEPITSAPAETPDTPQDLGQPEPTAQAVEPDEWAALAAHLITPPSAADEWESLREALL